MKFRYLAEDQSSNLQVKSSQVKSDRGWSFMFFTSSSCSRNSTKKYQAKQPEVLQLPGGRHWRHWPSASTGPSGGERHGSALYWWVAPEIWHPAGMLGQENVLVDFWSFNPTNKWVHLNIIIGERSCKNRVVKNEFKRSRHVMAKSVAP